MFNNVVKVSCLSLVLFMGLGNSIHAETVKPSDIYEYQVKNSSVADLSLSSVHSLTLGAVILFESEALKDRERTLKGIKTLDRHIADYVYPLAFYVGGIEQNAQKKSQKGLVEKNKEQLFDMFNEAARQLYTIDRACFTNITDTTNLHVSYRQLGQNNAAKTVSYVLGIKDCDLILVTLSGINNYQGHYYFNHIKASKYANEDGIPFLGSLGADTQNTYVAPVAAVDAATAMPKLQKSRTVIPFKFDLAGLFRSSTSANGNKVAPAKKGDLWGLIDSKGDWVVSPTYDEVGRLSEDVIAVKQGDLYHFINTQGATLSENNLVVNNYDNARYFSNGLAGVKEAKKWGFIGTKGQIIIPAQFDSVREFKFGFAPVKVNNKWGYINRKGQWLVKPIYDAAYNFTDAKIAVVVVKGKRGFIDTKGRFIIKPQFRRVQRFSEGLAAASKEKDRWFYIDSGATPTFDKYYSQVRTFSEGLSAVMNKQKKWGYINKEGRLLIPYQFDKAYDFKEGLALVSINKKRGFINKMGKLVVPAIYEDAYRFSEGMAPVKKEGKWGYISILP